ncbi:MAG: hypothetical protein QM687_07510 [Ferruginibacter sp.]
MQNINQYRFSPAFEAYKEDILRIIAEFGNDAKGTILVNNRNTVKFFDLGPFSINIKSFRPPHFINKIVYRYFRKSKARRSFENAVYLLEKQIGTPEPVAYLEETDALGLTRSYFISLQVKDVTELKQVLHDEQYPDRTRMIQLYTRFFYRIHEAGIQFLDNTQGNTLFKKNGSGYDLYLVDLNRMHTGKDLDTAQRMHNFSRLSPKDEVNTIIAEEYARLSGGDATQLLELLRKDSEIFWRKRAQQKKWKQKWKGAKK